jgi:hypothetical protein
MSALTGTTLFGRSCKLTVGTSLDPSLVQAQFNDSNTTGLDLSGLSISFVVEKSLVATEPNVATIKVWNLSEQSRQLLSKATALTVLLEAGYIGGTSQIYFAGARSAWSTREGANYITHIESSDTIARPSGVRRTKKILPGSNSGSIYRTMGPKVPLQQAFQAITTSLGIGEGNLKLALATGSAPITSVNGAALLGNGARRMTDLCRSAGLEWSVQDGELQLLNVGQTLSTTKAILISSASGLIDSPSVDSQGSLELKTLLIPGLAPGVLILVDSLFVQGGFRIEKIRYEGNTHGQDWYAHIAAAKY